MASAPRGLLAHHRGTLVWSHPCVADDRGAPMKDEIAKFQGTWKQIGYERDGIMEPHDEEEGWQPRTTFDGNAYVVTIADGSSPIKGTFTVDPTREPKTVDYT